MGTEIQLEVIMLNGGVGRPYAIFSVHKSESVGKHRRYINLRPGTAESRLYATVNSVVLAQAHFISKQCIM